MTFPSKTNYASGDILTAAQMNDIGSEINALNGTAGKNKIINGDFSIWQRGTSFTAASTSYTADRWFNDVFASGATTVTRQTFTPGSAPVAGYEGSFFMRINSSNTFTVARQRIEDVRTFAGQTVTLSFWAKSGSNLTLMTGGYQNFGSGGSAQVGLGEVGSSITTSWQRFTRTISVPSISGKTIGTSSNLEIFFYTSTLNTNVDLWGVQLEAGNLATAFQTATGTLAGELQAAQRYYFRVVSGGAYTPLTASAFSISTTAALGYTPFPVEMRIAPTALEQSGTANQYGLNEGGGGYTCSAVPTFNSATKVGAGTTFTFASGLTAGRGGWGRSDNNSTAYLAWSAEL